MQVAAPPRWSGAASTARAPAITPDLLLGFARYREDTDIEDRTIDSHVKRIRKKFKKIDPGFVAIETRYGSGYRWNVS